MAPATPRTTGHPASERTRNQDRSNPRLKRKRNVKSTRTRMRAERAAPAPGRSESAGHRRRRALDRQSQTGSRDLAPRSIFSQVVKKGIMITVAPWASADSTSRLEPSCRALSLANIAAPARDRSQRAEIREHVIRNSGVRNGALPGRLVETLDINPDAIDAGGVCALGQAGIGGDQGKAKFVAKRPIGSCRSKDARNLRGASRQAPIVRVFIVVLNNVDIPCGGPALVTQAVPDLGRHDDHHSALTAGCAPTISTWNARSSSRIDVMPFCACPRVG